MPFLVFIRERTDIMKKVGIIMGSDSDLPIVKKATDVLHGLGIPYEVHVYSAHRTPSEAADFAKNARDAGFGVIIAVAGMAAHLGGALAANTLLPIIGIPCKSSCFDGMDALLSTVMMPPGIPVASVGVDAGKNAALMAAEIIAVSDEELYERLLAERNAEKEKTLDKDRKVSLEFN